MRFNVEAIYEREDFERIGIEVTEIKYVSTIISAPGDSIDGIQLYRASVPEKFFREILPGHQFYILVELPAESTKVRDIGKLRMWVVSEAMGEMILKQQLLIATFINDQVKDESTGENDMIYGIRNGMSKEEYDHVEREIQETMEKELDLPILKHMNTPINEAISSNGFARILEAV